MSALLKNKAYEYIKSQILSCKYLPLSFLDVGVISNELGISRTPVRDAMALLEQEELVQIIPRHGVMVLGISADLISDIINTRRLVEPYCARIAALNADEEKLLHYKEIFSHPNMDIMSLIETDQEIHKYFISCSQNAYIINMMDRIYSNNFRLMLAGSSVPGRFEVANKEHIAILDAMLEKNPDKAEKCMLNHLNHAEESEYEAAGLLMKR